MKHRFFLLAALMCLHIARVDAQLLPALQPEQDACNAISICGGRFTTPYSYHGAGKLIEQSEYGGSDACFSETNSVWLKLTVAKAGTIAFTIIPYNSDNDYDFAVFDITNGNCSDLNAINRVRCNSSDDNSCYNGVTGLSNNTSGTVTGPGKGADFISSINASAGNVYLVLINNFSFGLRIAGFTIDFSASTAVFVQPKPAALSYVETDSLLPSQVVVHLTGKVHCSSIAANGSDFAITPGVTILSATGRDCRVGGYSSEIVLNLAQPLAAGRYTLNAQQGSDGNTLTEFCNSGLVLPDNVTFTAGNVPSFISPPALTDKLPDTQPGITLPAGPWRNVSYSRVVASSRQLITKYERPGLPAAKPDAAPAAPPTQNQPAGPEPEAILSAGGWSPMKNEGMVSTEKTPAKVYAISLTMEEPAPTQPDLQDAKPNYAPPQPAPTAVVPPAVTQTPVKQERYNNQQPGIILRPGRWHKMSFIGAILSPKFSMARHRRVRIPELDALLQKKPVVPPTFVTIAPPPAAPAAQPVANVDIVIPENFSPNGDGINDSFKLGDIKFLRIVEFSVYDKNGTELYSSANNSAAWDGLYKGKKQEAAVYQYTIRLAWPDGRIETHKGNVELEK